MKVFFSHLATAKIKKVVEISILKTLEYLKVETEFVEVSVMFASLNQIRELNNRTRNIDRVTDVLSYPANEFKPGEKVNLKKGETLFLGDMAICLKQAKMQAKEAKESYIGEISKLAVHSTLHLMGYDHIEDKDYIIMQKAEDDVKDILVKNNII